MNYANFISSIMDCLKERRVPSETTHGLPGPGVDRLPVKNQKNPKVPGSVKFIFSVLADRLGCTVGPFMTALSDICRHF
jgi:hypothetical protein